MKENVVRTMDNFSRVPGWRTNLTAKEVDFWIENYSDLIFCNGHCRRVAFEKVTDKNYIVYTRPL